MTYLPTDRSDEVATKGDIARLESRFDRLELRFDGLDGHITQMYETVIEQQKFYSRTTVWSMVGLTAIFSLVLTLFG